MNERILEAIDEEIARLRQVRAILTAGAVSKAAARAERKPGARARKAIAAGQNNRPKQALSEGAQQKKDAADLR